MSESYYSFKILIVGNSSVGKSSIMLRYADKIFHQEMQSTIGVDLKLRTHTIEDQIVKLFVWDTAGQDKFKTIISSYYKGAKAILFVFDLTDPQSLESVVNWQIEALQHCNFEPIKILIGNKRDLAQVKNPQKKHKVCPEAEEFARNHGMTYYEVSAKSGYGVEDLFDLLARQLYKQSSSNANKNKSNGSSLKINTTNLSQKKQSPWRLGCC